MDKKIKQQIDKSLIEIKRRQAGSVEQLYFLISPTITYIALKYLKNEEYADDLVQDFWADIFRIADKFYYCSNSFSYLCKVMTRKAINRSKQLNKERVKIQFVDYGTMHNFGCVTNSKDFELKIEIEKVISGLQEKEKIILQQSYFEEKTVRQIAKELKISKSEVSRVKILAITKMKRALEEIGVDKFIL